ncbi:MAG TPA: DUF1467 family protein [Parvularculaceae bacterium]|nr:DUF1467 family protein [Parvularculaceae bacterium]
MNIVGAIVIYIMVWWVIVFAVLPWGVRGRWESPDDGVKGAEPGAPAVTHLKKKLLITSVIAFGVTVVLVALISAGFVNFRE